MAQNGRATKSKGKRPSGETGDPFADLINDHRRVEELFERIEDAQGDERQRLVDELAAALRLHMQLEEDIVYPILAEDVDEDMAEEADVEHDLAREGLEQVERLSPDGPGFGAALEMLAAGISHHVDEEETEVFPGLHDKLDTDELGELGERLTTAREAGERQGGTHDRSANGTTGPSRGGRRGSSGDANTSSKGANGSTDEEPTEKQPTKKELLARAKKAGIEGTSSMTKAELADALSGRC